MCPKKQVSVVIPAYNEQERIGFTLDALVKERWISEIIVVDDGSTDLTHRIAEKYTTHVLSISKNVGKAEALRRGGLYARYPILVFLDADLKESARHAKKLVEPLWCGGVDMTIAVFPQTRNGGYGLVKKIAQYGIHKKTGVLVKAPLCGQRAVMRHVFHSVYRGDTRFGIEVGLTLDCIQAGYSVKEVEIPFEHRELGKSLTGFTHRCKQGIFVCLALLNRRS